MHISSAVGGITEPDSDLRCFIPYYSYLLKLISQKVCIDIDYKEIKICTTGAKENNLL